MLVCWREGKTDIGSISSKGEGPRWKERMPKTKVEIRVKLKFLKVGGGGCNANGKKDRNHK